MNKKIMVVDDEPDILTTVGQMLEMSGYEVIRATDGKECLKLLDESNSNPDLIVLDIMMPDISGWDVAAKLKENPKWNSIPIVFLTAKGDTMSVGMGGMASVDYIVKPFDIKDLIVRIKKILGNE
ncbi:MAG: response regulator transcription factor [Thermoplasmatales archaeon]|nr:response regulator transcription factor [Thermoplasmatales archaeon]MCK4995770.1 response regulator transcription factor [Thermoplasmatales archaeon]MCK5636332.1 response regulator transcription factor [Thermoplasmatales archaeon]